MNSSSQNTALPTWIFIATDLALIGAAAVIALLSPHPLTTGAILWIVGCVIVGAIIGLVPLVARYERLKNEALDERQHALEALARTVSSTAEQISIATSGLHEIAESAHKNLRAAEQLPHKLQEKIAEFQAQLSATVDTEKEELERELLALRTSESERLDSVSQRIAKSSAEWTKLEAATHEHLTAANQAVAKLASGTAEAIGKAQAAAEQALTQARVEAARALGEASGTASRAIESARSTALAEFDARLAAVSVTLVDRVLAELNLKRTTSPRAPVHANGTTVESEPEASVAPIHDADTAAGAVEPEIATAPSEASLAATPRRSRKTRRDEPAATGAENHETASVVPAAPVPVSPPAPPPAPAEEIAPASVDEPLPVPSNTIPEITPIAPETAEPFPGQTADSSASSAPAPASTEEIPTPPSAAADAVKSPRKRPAKRAEEDDEPGLGLDLDDSSASPTSSTSERIRTSDGATRLLVTAYIGIGNRLFIRGDGPGLSWEKGIPLQFVSIGKWRWETNDAAAPVHFKLFKNDDQECGALGAQSLDPGHQQEVTAAF